mgnify:CR=1 FL=1
MNKRGGRYFGVGTGRKKPTKRARGSGTGSIFLADYDGPIEKADTIRLHPDRQRYDESITDALRRHRTAIGYRTTALVNAALEGLDIVCKDENSIMAQPNWLELLPYADWHFSEIQNGDIWEHLQL